MSTENPAPDIPCAQSATPGCDHPFVDDTALHQDRTAESFFEHSFSSIPPDVEARPILPRGYKFAVIGWLFGSLALFAAFSFMLLAMMDFFGPYRFTCGGLSKGSLCSHVLDISTSCLLAGTLFVPFCASWCVWFAPTSELRTGWKTRFFWSTLVCAPIGLLFWLPLINALME